jgi:hypothetical protein
MNDLIKLQKAFFILNIISDTLTSEKQSMRSLAEWSHRRNISGGRQNGKRNSITAKMAAQEAERAAHRAAQQEKDLKFAEFLKTLELGSIL